MKKKLLFLVQLPPPIHGASIINKQIIDIECIQNDYIIKILPFNFVEQLKEIGGFSFTKIYLLVQVFYKLMMNLFSYKPDLVFFNLSFKGGAFYRDLIYITLIKLFRRKILYHLQGKGISEQWLNNKFKKALYKYVFKNTNVICLSKLITNDLSGVYFDMPYIVNNGIETQSFEGKPYSNEKNITTLIYLSALAYEKGLMVLLEAIRLLNAKNCDFELKIIGSPFTMTDNDIFDYLQKNNLTGKVKILGAKYNDDKFKELIESDIFLHPTLNDAFPLVLLEAMQSSLPIVSTFEGAIPEIVDDGITGFLVEKNNPEALAEKIEILINNPDLRKRMGEAGRKKILENYTLDIFEKNMKGVFDEILNNG